MRRKINTLIKAMKITNETLQKAIEFATKAHQGQYRKGTGVPYILHPMDVMLTLNSIKRSNNMLLICIVAMLHDCVEDCDVTLEEIAREFGYKVASLVGELTTDKVQCKLKGKRIYLTEKMLGMSSYALRIKLADRLVNMRDMHGMSNEHKLEKVSETQFIIMHLRDGRELTSTHSKLIKLTEKEMNKILKQVA